MSSKSAYFFEKTLLFICDSVAHGILWVSMFMWALNIKDHTGYQMDGLTAAVVISACVLILICNAGNKRSCEEMHSRA